MTKQEREAFEALREAAAWWLEHRKYLKPRAEVEEGYEGAIALTHAALAKAEALEVTHEQE